MEWLLHNLLQCTQETSPSLILGNKRKDTALTASRFVKNAVYVKGNDGCESVTKQRKAATCEEYKRVCETTGSKWVSTLTREIKQGLDSGRHRA